ncbi:MAG: hypothetical protein ACLS61_16760 [Ruminococcus sp.]
MVLPEKNLKRLTDFSLDIQNFQPGDLTRQYDVGYMDEVGVLKDSFNKMIRRTERSGHFGVSGKG